MAKPQDSRPIPLFPAPEKPEKRAPAVEPSPTVNERLLQGSEGLRKASQKINQGVQEKVEALLVRVLDAFRAAGRKLGAAASYLTFGMASRLLPAQKTAPAAEATSSKVRQPWGWNLLLWWRGRSLRRYFRGTPVLLFMVAAGLLWMMASDSSDHVLIHAYRAKGDQAMGVRDFATARVFERALQLGDEPSRTYYRLALAAEGAGQVERARLLWEHVAPADGPGFAPAHLNRARRLLREAGSGNAAARQQAEQHLLSVVKLAKQAPKAGSTQGTKDQLELWDLEATLVLAELYLQEKRDAEAEKQLVRAVALDVDLSDYEQSVQANLDRQVSDRGRVLLGNKARVLLGRLYTRQKKYKRAENYLQAAAYVTPPTDPTWLEMQTLLGRIYVRSSLYEEAEPYLKKALAQSRPPEPVLVETYSLLGEVHLFRDRLAEAEAAFLQALAVPVPPQPATVEAHVLLGQLYENQRRIPVAEKHYRQAIALRMPEEPATVLAQALLGRMYLQMRRFAEAEPLLQAAAQTKLPGTSAQQEAQALLGQLYQRTGRSGDAVAPLQAVMKGRPEVRLALARALRAQGQHEPALAQAREAVAYFRKRAIDNLFDADAHVFWAEAVAFQGDYRGSTELLERFLAELRRMPLECSLGSGELSGGAAYLWLKDLRRQYQERYRAALFDLHAQWLGAVERHPQATPAQRLALQERMLLLEPMNLQLAGQLFRAAQVTGPDADRQRADWQSALAGGYAPVLARILLACDALNRHQPAEARKLLDEALERAPDMAIVVNNVAWLWGNLSITDTPKAVILMDAVVARQPAQPNFLDTRGQLLMKVQRWDAARQDFEKALPNIKNKSAVHTKLAEVYRQLGNTGKAAEHARLAKR